MNILIGKSSRLTYSLSCKLKNTRIFRLDEELLDFLKKNSAHENVYIFLCSSITDPKESGSDFNEFDRLLEALFNQITAQMTLVAFGTVLETTEYVNNYVESKRNLLKKIKKYSDKFNFKYKYFRLNTLYGVGLPKKHMFLYELLNSIRNGNEFNMSSGQQYREYHHYDDVASEVIRICIENDNNEVINMNSGDGVKLIDLANYIKKSMGSEILIKANGVCPTEIYQKLGRDDKIKPLGFRDPYVGVVEYLKGISNEE